MLLSRHFLRHLFAEVRISSKHSSWIFELDSVSSLPWLQGSVLEISRCQRNKVTALKRESVKDFCFDAACVCSKCSPGLFWEKLRPLLPNSKSSVNTSLICLLENGRIVPDNSASEYFTSPTINESVLTFSVDEVSSHASVVNIETKAPRINFSFHPVSVARVSEILSNLNVRKPAGPYGIPPKLLKIAAPVIAGPMTKLFNYCIDVGEWPCQWKLSNVTPVHKKDDETSKTNYRPISVLSVIPKVFEKLKFDQLYSVFTPVFSDNISGLLSGHSCYSSLLKLTDDWRQALDNKKDVAVVAIDLSKAFDSICHNLLLAKLKAYGVHDSAIKLIQSYQSGHFQRVKCNEKVSDWLSLRCGVPQGNLLGPLFLISF